METINQFFDAVKAGINFLLVITILVFVHELGHFWFAKMFGMKVDAFAVMMGGLRQKGLEASLEKPLISAKIVGLIYTLTAIAAVVSMNNNWVVPQTIFLGILAFIMPFWIASRIGKLYRYDLATFYKPILLSYAAGTALLFFGTRFQTSATFFVALMFGASLIGLMFLYYKPLGVNAEESETMGFGAIEIDGAETVVRYRPLWCTERNGTEFSLLLLPLGGFAKIRGMHPKEDGSEINIEHGFYSKPAFSRFMVLFAGPLFSILLGVVLYFAGFVTYGEYRSSNQPVVGELVSGGVGEVAGFKKGDRFIAINDVPVASFYDVVSKVRNNAGQNFSFLVERNGKQLSLTAIPKLENDESPVWNQKMEPTGEMAKQGKLGIAPMRGEFHPLTISQAAQSAINEPFKAFSGLANIISHPGQAKNSVAGPAGIATATQSASQDGLRSVLLLAAGLSISLGFMNLLPIHPLDGGQMVVAFIEMFRRKRLSMKAQGSFSMVGVSLLLLLMVAVWSQDISRANKPEKVIKFVDSENPKK